MIQWYYMKRYTCTCKIILNHSREWHVSCNQEPWSLPRGLHRLAPLAAKHQRQLQKMRHGEASRRLSAWVFLGKLQVPVIPPLIPPEKYTYPFWPHKNPPVYGLEILWIIFVFWCSWGVFQGSVEIFLESCLGYLLGRESSSPTGFFSVYLPW